MARQSAEAYLRENGHTTLPIDPFAIAAKHEIDVKAKPDTADGVSGMLLRHGNNFGILYATHTGSEGFERFSVGHELGHYFLGSSWNRVGDLSTEGLTNPRIP
jgi:Zn-dependent peptidase ImmA (M78 family)